MQRIPVKVDSLRRRICFLAVLAAAINAVSIALLGSYDLHLGPVHLAAHGIFKPILYLCGALLIAAAANESEVKADAWWSPSPWLIASTVAMLYLPSLGITIAHNDWTHQADVRDWNSLAAFAHLFVW